MWMGKRDGNYLARTGYHYFYSLDNQDNPEHSDAKKDVQV